MILSQGRSNLFTASVCFSLSTSSEASILLKAFGQQGKGTHFYTVQETKEEAVCPRSHHTQQEVLGEAAGGLTMDRAHTMPLSRQIESTAFQA